MPCYHLPDMPFTFAHPAAVLPLARWSGRWLVFSALVIGAMAPDFGYLFPGGYVHSRTHGPWSLLWFSLPAGLLVWWLFQILVKEPLIALSPAAWRARLARLSAPHPAARGRGLPGVILSVAIGAASHQLIDAATHGSGALVQAVPALKAVVLRIGDHPVPAYNLLQHGLSLIGLTALAWCGLRWLHRAQVESDGQVPPGLPPAVRRILWALLALVPAATAVAAYGFYMHKLSFKLAVGYSVVAAIGAIGLELLALGLVWRFVRGGGRIENPN